MPDRARPTVWGTLRRYLLRGFLVWIPLAAVVLVGRLIYSIIQSWFFPSLGWEPRLTALGVVAAVLLLTGWAVSRFGVAGPGAESGGRAAAEPDPGGALDLFRGARTARSPLHQRGTPSGKVVLIEYPRRGVYSIAFQMAGGLGEVQHRVLERVASANREGADREDADAPRPGGIRRTPRAPPNARVMAGVRAHHAEPHLGLRRHPPPRRK